MITYHDCSCVFTDGTCDYVKWPLCKKKYSVRFSMMLQSQVVIENKICVGNKRVEAALGY